ncbi:hypothetical protein J6590_029584 [Homalodisca vitripennis]|nr:hypothetical protein J6590_029584 [Homalodisca vitripennis]
MAQTFINTACELIKDGTADNVTNTTPGILNLHLSEEIQKNHEQRQLYLVYPADNQCNLEEEVFSLSHQVHYNVLDTIPNNVCDIHISDAALNGR